MNVEARLKEIVGEPAGRLHTARSRNDQVATDFKLWVRDQIDASIEGIEALMKALIGQAEVGYNWVMPGFTHLQTAQPVTWRPPWNGVRPPEGGLDTHTALAEGEGFEPSVTRRPQRLSRPPHSSALATFRRRG